MNKKLLLSTALVLSAIAASPAQAVIIAPGTSGLIFTPFVSATQGVRLASTSVPLTGLTFSTIMRSAVYRNTLGTVDFYYQVARTGAGTAASDMIDAFTAANFRGFTVDGFVSAADPDGINFFTAANNPPSSTTRTGRNANGGVLQTDFGTNGLSGTETSATYIFRTNAVNFKQGTFGIIDGSSVAGLAFAPAGVPEPAAWSLMIGGFGLIGAAMRRRSSRITSVTA
jgi:PEP-CTERM motif